MTNESDYLISRSNFNTIKKNAIIAALPHQQKISSMKTTWDDVLNEIDTNVVSRTLVYFSCAVDMLCYLFISLGNDECHLKLFFCLNIEQ